MSLSDFTISTDRSLVDAVLVQHFLSDSYWAAGRSLAAVQATIQHSACFSGFLHGQQIAFGRLVTDTVVIAYFADVFVVPPHRGNGYGRALIDAMLDYTDSRGISVVLLRTRDAHGLYEKVGFSPLPDVHEMMRRPIPKGAQ